MGLHKSLDEKVCNILSSAKNAIKKSSEIINEKNIPSPVFMDLDSVISAFHKYPNIRPIIEELNDWNECKLMYFSDDRLKLKDVSELEITAIIEKSDTIYIFSNDGIYESSDGINFGKSDSLDLQNISIDTTSITNDKCILIDRFNNTHISSFIWAYEKNLNISISTANGNSIFKVKEFMSKIIAIYLVFEKYLLVVTGIEYYWIEIDNYVEHIYSTMDTSVNDTEYMQSNIFVFKDTIKAVTDIENNKDMCILSGILSNGDIFVINITKSMDMRITYCDKGTKYDNISHIGFGYILRTNNETMTASLFKYDEKNDKLLEIVDNFHIYPSYTKDNNFGYIRAIIHNKNYNIFMDNDVFWCSPEYPAVNSQGVFTKAVKMNIVPFIRDYVKFWKTKKFIYILNSVGSLYRFKLPEYIADSFFSTDTSPFVPGFANIIKNGIIGKDIEGLVWHRINSKLSHPFTSIQTACGCGIGLILKKDTVSDIYRFYKVNNYELVEMDDIASIHYELYQHTIPPININQLKPSTHNILIASANNKFYIIAYNLSSRICHMYICSGGLKSGIFRQIEIDNNLIAYFNRAVYAFGYDGLITIVMNAPSSSHYPTFCFDPENPMVSTSNFVPYTTEWLNSYNSTPDIYESNGQIMDNRPNETSIYIPSHTNIGYGDKNCILKISNTDEIANDSDLFHVTKSIDRTAIFYMSKYDEDGPYNEDVNAKLVSYQYQLDGSILRSDFELMKHIYTYKDLVPRGMIYRLANSIIYLDLINRVGLITYDGFQWYIMENGNIPSGTAIYYIGHIGEMNIVITDVGTFINKQIEKVIHNNYIYEKHNIFCIEDKYMSFTHHFDFIPATILVNIKMVTDLWTRYINIKIGSNEIQDNGNCIYKSLSISDDTSNLIFINEECDVDWGIYLHNSVLYISNSGNFMDSVSEVQSSHIQIIALV